MGSPSPPAPVCDRRSLLTKAATLCGGQGIALVAALLVLVYYPLACDAGVPRHSSLQQRGLEGVSAGVPRHSSLQQRGLEGVSAGVPRHSSLQQRVLEEVSPVGHGDLSRHAGLRGRAHPLIREREPTQQSVQTGKQDLPRLGCNNTVQGRHLLTDDQGYICSLRELDTETGCCPKTGRQYDCTGCNVEKQCCNEYEFCVACCLDPAQTTEEIATQQLRGSQEGTGFCTGVFDYCHIRCRHNSHNVVHENAYISDAHHCFSKAPTPVDRDQQAAAQLSAELENVELRVANPGEHCASACGSVSRRCALEKLPVINRCSVIEQHLNCSQCIQSMGADQPAEVISEAPQDQHPGACLFNTDESLFSCGGSHPLTRRLCPCM